MTLSRSRLRPWLWKTGLAAAVLLLCAGLLCVHSRLTEDALGPIVVRGTFPGNWLLFRDGSGRQYLEVCYGRAGGDPTAPAVRCFLDILDTGGCLLASHRTVQDEGERARMFALLEKAAFSRSSAAEPAVIALGAAKTTALAAGREFFQEWKTSASGTVLPLFRSVHGRPHRHFWYCHGGEHGAKCAGTGTVSGRGR